MATNISKLIIIGEGEKEIVYFQGMSFELEGTVLKIYLTPGEKSILPLELKPLVDIGEDNNEI